MAEIWCEHNITWRNGSHVYTKEYKFMPSDPLCKKYGSFQNTFVFAEEAGQTHPEILGNISLSSGRWKNDQFMVTQEMQRMFGFDLGRAYPIPGKTLYIANPTTGYLKNQFFTPAKHNDLPDHRKFINCLPQDNPAADPAYIRKLQNDPDENRRRRLLMGDWDFDDDPSRLYEFNKIMAMFRNAGRYTTGQMYITCDVARLGGDKTVIMVWDGLDMIHMEVIERSRLNVVVDMIVELEKRFNVPRDHIAIDVNGLGGGVVDHHFLLGCIGFDNNAAPKKVIRMNGYAKEEVVPPYFRLPDQCAYKLSDLVRDERIGIRVQHKYQQDIADEMAQVKQYKTENNGKLRKTPKSIIKMLLGRSTDYYDAIMMRLYFSVDDAVEYDEDTYFEVL